MNMKADNTQEAARLIMAFGVPLEIEIPRQADVWQFIRGVHYYLKLWQTTALISDASTNDSQIIYVYEKGQ